MIKFLVKVFLKVNLQKIKQRKEKNLLNSIIGFHSKARLRIKIDESNS